MIVSKQMAAILGGLFFAAILGFIPKGCAHQPQPAKQALAIAQPQPAKQALAIAQPQPLPLPTNPDPWAGISDQERLHGDAEIPLKGGF
jgi:hypothetical protein